MNCGELIKELEQLDSNTPVVFPDSEQGYRNVQVVAITRMLVFHHPVFTYDLRRAGMVGIDELPTCMVAILEERRA